jgi:hypothetical protein
VALAVQYVNANPKSGKYVLSADGKLPALEYEIGYLQCGKQNYRALSAIIGDDSLLTDLDIIMTHKNPQVVLQGFLFTVATNKALWKQDPIIVKAVATEAQSLYEKQLPKRLGKTLPKNGATADFSVLDEI